MKTVSSIAVALALLALISGAVLAQSANDLFQQALVKERTEGNFVEAIKLYQRIIQKYGSDRRLAAKALFQMGQAYEKLGDAEARKAYERIAREFPDQKDVAQDANRRLAALQGVRSTEALAVRHVFTTSAFPTQITSDGRLMGIADGYKSAIGVRDMSSGQIKWVVPGDESGTEGECTIVSPDQRQVVYAWYPRINGVTYGEVRLVGNEVGSKPRVLVPIREEYEYVDPLAWAPDGKAILVVIRRRDQTWQFGWVSVADGAIKVLKSLEWRLRAGRASLSPDGKYVTYAALDTNPSSPIPNKGPLPSDITGQHIYVLASDGSTESDLTKAAGINSEPIWTADGTHILFMSDRYGTQDLWSVSMQNGKTTGPAFLVKRNMEGTWPMGMTRSGSYYYGQGGGDIRQNFVVEMEPGGRKLRGDDATKSEPLIGFGPVWAPDGKSIAFLRMRSKTELIRIVHSFDTGDEKVYFRPGIVAGPARWLSDGTGLLESIQNADGTHSVYRVDLKSGQFTPVWSFNPLPKNGFLGPLAPDDKTLYEADSDSHSILAFDLASGQRRTVFTLPGSPRLGGFELSDDGRKLALQILGDKGNFSIATVSTNGSDYRELYSGQNSAGVRLAWAKDRGGILFSEYRDASWKIMRISEEGGQPEFTGVEHSSFFMAFHLNKDGSRLAFTSNESLGGWEVFSLDNVTTVLKTAK